MSNRTGDRTVPASAEGVRGEDGHIGYLLRQAAAAHRQRIERALVPTGLTAAQFSILTMLNAYPGASGAAIARVALVTPQTLGAIVANLEKMGLVDRRPHEEHGRIKRLAVTEGGRATLARARTLVGEVDREVTAGLVPEEDAIVRRWLAAAAR